MPLGENGQKFHRFCRGSLRDEKPRVGQAVQPNCYLRFLRGRDHGCLRSKSNDDQPEVGLTTIFLFRATHVLPLDRQSCRPGRQPSWRQLHANRIQAAKWYRLFHTAAKSHHRDAPSFLIFRDADQTRIIIFALPTTERLTA